MTRTSGPRRATAAPLIAATLWTSQATGRAEDPPTAQEIYDKPGPHPVATAVRTSIAGTVTHIGVANRVPSSPLFVRIDLGRTVFGGHSAGGQAALQAATVFPAAAPPTH
ncbi:hypothetical protein ABZ540_06595 [Nocardia xishanensis]|uniref:hypothetical protein n=1 Tax=Nocardia xishanensis TaxID=238964 RepID=UPI0033C4EDDD